MKGGLVMLAELGSNSGFGSGLYEHLSVLQRHNLLLAASSILNSRASAGVSSMQSENLKHEKVCIGSQGDPFCGVKCYII
jgi:hypothetical protein